LALKSNKLICYFYAMLSKYCIPLRIFWKSLVITLCSILLSCGGFTIGYFETNPGISYSGPKIDKNITVSMRMAVEDNFLISEYGYPNVEVSEFRKTLSTAFRNTFNDTFRSMMWLDGFNDEGVSLVVAEVKPNWYKKATTSAGSEIGSEISYQVLIYIEGTLKKTVSKKVHSNLSASPSAGAVNLMRDALQLMCIEIYKEVVDGLEKSGTGNGTGFLVSDNGYIVTNSHVVENALSIKVKGVNGDFTKEYDATVVADDSSNDLALLKIEGATFEKVPFPLRTVGLEKGEDVFVLGYPKISTMGEEVKLTKGIISSKRGYQDNSSSFQVSAAIQGGNSGSPLFDDKGNLIGVMNAKHRDTEGVSYAIKSSLVRTLFENNDLELQTTNTTTLDSLSFSAKVKKLSDFVYIVLVEK